MSAKAGKKQSKLNDFFPPFKVRSMRIDIFSPRSYRYFQCLNLGNPFVRTHSHEDYKQNVAFAVRVDTRIPENCSVPKNAHLFVQTLEHPVF